MRPASFFKATESNWHYRLNVPSRDDNEVEIAKDSPRRSKRRSKLGDPGRTEIYNGDKGLIWQNGLTASIESKGLYAPLANREGGNHARTAS